MAKKPKERQRYIVRLENGQLYEVSREVYLCFYSGRRLERYWREKDAAYEVIGIEDLLRQVQDGSRRGDILVDASADVYNQVVRRMENEQLHRAIDRLNDEEKHMIYELFFREKKLTRLAEESGVSWQTVQEKRDNILRKLKRIFMQYAEKI